MTNFLPWLWKNLWRRRLRTIFTLLSIATAFFLFGMLSALNNAFNAGVELAGQDRLMTLHRISIVQPVPEAYGSRISSVDGVEAVTHATFFAGVYQNPRNVFGQIAVAPNFFDLHPEFVVPADRLAAWHDNRIGVIVGEATARRFGWRVGDRVPLQGTIWRNEEPDGVWQFEISGIYRGAKPGTDETSFVFHHRYFDEARAYGQGMVGWFVVQVADSSRAAEIAASIDATFANSTAETKTSTEAALLQGYAHQIGDIGKITRAILTIVFVTILFIVGSSMAQAIRERARELAVLKSVGFTDARVVVLTLAEAITVALLGGGGGLAIAALVVGQGDPTAGALPAFFLSTKDAVAALVLMILLGLAAGALPAVEARRLTVAEELRRR